MKETVVIKSRVQNNSRSRVIVTRKRCGSKYWKGLRRTEEYIITNMIFLGEAVVSARKSIFKRARNGCYE